MSRETATTEPTTAARRLARGAWGRGAGSERLAYGRHVGGLDCGGGRGVVSPVSVTRTTMPGRSVTNLRPGWVSQKNLAPASWQFDPCPPKGVSDDCQNLPVEAAG